MNIDNIHDALNLLDDELISLQEALFTFGFIVKKLQLNPKQKIVRKVMTTIHLADRLLYMLNQLN